MNTANRKVPIAQLADAIEVALKRAPSLIQDLCLELGYSRHAVYVRLLDLMAAGRVRYVEVRTAGGLGLARQWHPGRASAEELEELLRARLARAAVPDRGPIEQPCQVTLRTYPALRRRDPLVAAFFGQVGTKGAANA